MANNATLKAAIQQVIKENGTNAITGPILQQTLLAMVNSLGANYQYVGLANPDTAPGTPDQNVFYIAFEPGTYSNFGGRELFAGELAVFKYNGTWAVDVIGIIDDLLLKYKKTPITRISRLSGKRFDASGNIVDQQYFAIDLFAVEPGEIYNIVGVNVTQTNSYEYAIYNSAQIQDATTCIVVGPQLLESFDADVKIPAGGVILAVQSYIAAEKLTTTKYESLFEYIEQLADSLETEIETTNQELFAERLVGVTAERENGYNIHYNGNIRTNEYGSIYRISVNPGEKYKISLPTRTGPTGQYSYAIYNSTTPSSATLLRLGPEINEAFTEDVTIPPGGVLLIWGRVIDYAVVVQKYEQYSRITALEQGAATKHLFLQYGNDGVKVNQKYSNALDIQYWLQKFGVNSLMQLYAHGFVANDTPVVSQSNPASYTLSGSDWIGPYIMSALQNPTGGGGGFTGGCHGSNGDQTGDPTAETLDVQVYADNRNVSVGSSVSCDDVRVVVKNRIRAGNTQGASGRYVLEEIVTYHFKDNKIYVSVCSEALENIRVSTYYGMQMNNYSNSAMFFGKTTKAGTFSPSTSFPEKCFLGIGFNSNGRMCAMHLETVGLGCNDHTDTTKYCFTSGNKMYYSLVNPNNTLTVDGGVKFYWAGWYQFTDVQKLDELTY